jgi:hypothetical protein
VTNDISEIQLRDAGYAPEQILTCQRGDPCWCQLSSRFGRGYVRAETCGLSKPQAAGMAEIAAGHPPV